MSTNSTPRSITQTWLHALPRLNVVHRYKRSVPLDHELALATAYQAGPNIHDIDDYAEISIVVVEDKDSDKAEQSLDGARQTSTTITAEATDPAPNPTTPASAVQVEGDNITMAVPCEEERSNDTRKDSGRKRTRPERRSTLKAGPSDGRKRGKKRRGTKTRSETQGSEDDRTPCPKRRKVERAASPPGQSLDM